MVHTGSKSSEGMISLYDKIVFFFDDFLFISGLVSANCSLEFHKVDGIEVGDNFMNITRIEDLEHSHEKIFFVG